MADRVDTTADSAPSPAGAPPESLRAARAMARGFWRVWLAAFGIGMALVIALGVGTALLNAQGAAAGGWAAGVAWSAMATALLVGAIALAPALVALVSPLLIAAELPPAPPLSERSLLLGTLAWLVRMFWAAILLVLAGIVAGFIAQGLDEVSLTYRAERDAAGAAGPAVGAQVTAITSTVALLTQWLDVVIAIGGFVGVGALIVLYARVWRAGPAARFDAAVRVLTRRSTSPRVGERRGAVALLMSHWAHLPAAILLIALCGLAIPVMLAAFADAAGEGLIALIRLLSGQ